MSRRRGRRNPSGTTWAFVGGGVVLGGVALWLIFKPNAPAAPAVTASAPAPGLTPAQQAQAAAAASAAAQAASENAAAQAQIAAQAAAARAMSSGADAAAHAASTSGNRAANYQLQVTPYAPASASLHVGDKIQLIADPSYGPVTFVDQGAGIMLTDLGGGLYQATRAGTDGVEVHNTGGTKLATAVIQVT